MDDNLGIFYSILFFCFKAMTEQSTVAPSTTRLGKILKEESSSLGPQPRAPPWNWAPSTRSTVIHQSL